MRSLARQRIRFRLMEETMDGAAAGVRLVSQFRGLVSNDPRIPGVTMTIFVNSGHRAVQL